MLASATSYFTNFLFQLNTSSVSLSILRIVCLHKHILLPGFSPSFAIGYLHIQHIVLNIILVVLMNLQIFYLFDLKIWRLEVGRGVNSKIIITFCMKLVKQEQERLDGISRREENKKY